MGTRRRQRTQGAKNRSTGRLGGLAAAGAAGVALTGALALGAAPTLTSSPQLLAALHYLRGTNIGFIPSEQQYEDFISTVIDGSGLTPPTSYEEVAYNAGFRPFSHGGFADLSYDDSVVQGAQLLADQQAAEGDVIFGFSQGAVAASLYKATHTGNTYVLVGNPSRPNGGVMQRFRGLTIPFVDVTFSGATPVNGDFTVDVVRQYDGWADFPTYLWNPVAIANAFMGIVLVHGNTQLELTSEDLDLAEQSGSEYYQFDEHSNTAYYVIKTYPVPLLMPFDWLPDPILAALDAPLRWFIETAYDRTDYSQPLRSRFFAPLNLFSAAVADEQETEGGLGDEVAARIANTLFSGDPAASGAVDDAPAGEQGLTAVHEAGELGDAGNVVDAGDVVDVGDAGDVGDEALSPSSDHHGEPDDLPADLHVDELEEAVAPAEDDGSGDAADSEVGSTDGAGDDAGEDSAAAEAGDTAAGGTAGDDAGAGVDAGADAAA
ncbi:PE-PPE domain-containing protein [Mycolicibacterium poriferae]|uniref:PE-PPE domain-containing protein n=1 Tax=Mycolicibacterium poriferae TaxID=39694 RepID=UPI001F471877|nr:PE-PPE domain-containing protein [Mycolicibacterium poriferae]